MPASVGKCFEKIGRARVFSMFRSVFISRSLEFFRYVNMVRGVGVKR